MVKLEPSAEKQYAKVLTELEWKNEKQAEKLSYGYGVRHLQMFIIFASLTVIYISRAQLSASIVAMTDVKSINDSFETNMMSVHPNHTTKEKINAHENSEAFRNKTYEDKPQDEFYLQEDNSLDNISIFNETSENITSIKKSDNDSNVWNVFRVYAWPKSSQEMVLGAFFLGYMIMMSPMGLVCQRWGGKVPLQISLFSSGIITFFTPWLAMIGDYKAVCITRVAIGLSQAGTYPGIHTLIAKWIPVSERGRFASYVYAGSMVGTVSAYHISGFLSVSTYGWPSVFWVTGVLCMLMGMLTTCMVASSPQQHSSIREEEKNFILGGVKDQTEMRYSTPWKAILRSKAVWACFAPHVGTSVNFVFMFTQIPTYLHHAVGLNIKSSGLLSSLPYLSNFFMSIILGIVSDYCINKNILSMKLVRILSCSLATVGPAIGLFALTFIPSPAFAVGCMIFSMGCMSGTHTGWMVNYIDMAPNFSGTLMATGNTLMNIGAVLLPVLVSNIVRDVTDLNQWRIVVFIVGSFGLLTNVIYAIFMSIEVQPWNAPEYHLANQEELDKQEEKYSIVQADS